MSLYNAVNGVSPAVLWVLPMLGKHPSEYPRFRDCFIETELAQEICVYTRAGGGNREAYKAEIDELRAMPDYIRDTDDDFDSTYATFDFKVPERWQADFDKIIEGKVSQLSDEYIAEVKRVFSKLADRVDEFVAAVRKSIAEEKASNP